MKKPIINYDKKSDVFYIAIKNGYEEIHQEVAPGIFIELDKKRQSYGN